jgi:hypothetical protein
MIASRTAQARPILTDNVVHPGLGEKEKKIDNHERVA